MAKGFGTPTRRKVLGAGHKSPLQKVFALRRGFRPDFFDNLTKLHKKDDLKR